MPAQRTATPLPKDEPFAENPPSGAMIDYYLKSAPAGPVTLEILDAAGQTIRRYSSEDRATPRDPNTLNVRPSGPPRPSVVGRGGMHRWVWDLRPSGGGGGRGRRPSCRRGHWSGRGPWRGAGAGAGALVPQRLPALVKARAVARGPEREPLAPPRLRRRPRRGRGAGAGGGGGFGGGGGRGGGALAQPAPTPSGSPSTASRSRSVDRETRSPPQVVRTRSGPRNGV